MDRGGPEGIDAELERDGHSQGQAAWGRAVLRTCARMTPAVKVRPAPSIALDDPRQGRSVLPAAWARGLLNDPRDAIFLDLMIQSALCVVAGAGMFFTGRYLWYLAPIYWLLGGVVVLDRFILMLHCTSHRPLFRPRFRRLNLIIPWILGPVLGQTPDSYFVHHLGMHHREENAPGDASSTMKYRRDRIDHWLRYVFRFQVVGIIDLIRYLRRQGSPRLISRLVRGEVVFWLAVIALAFVNLQATLVVFAIPVVLVRLLMMTGNWAQHAFICAGDWRNPYRNSLTCINNRYNRRCFNDGYHISHHLEARRHWTEHPGELEANLERYGAEDAVVLEGIDFFGVWLCLMLGRWNALARAFVRLPNAPARTDAQVIALLKERLVAIDAG
jgi:fatty acid desaturase